MSITHCGGCGKWTGTSSRLTSPSICCILSHQVKGGSSTLPAVVQLWCGWAGDQRTSRLVSTHVLRRTIIETHVAHFYTHCTLKVSFYFAKMFVRLFAIWQQDSKLFVNIVLAPYEYTLLYALNLDTSRLKLSDERKHYKKIKYSSSVFFCVKNKQMHVLLGDYAWSAKFCVLFMITINSSTNIRFLYD